MKKLFRGPIGRSAVRERSLPADKLAAELLRPAYLGHAGIPGDADALAYEPVQRILAVGTADGRVKVIGQPGVEQTLSCSRTHGTRSMQFATNLGALLRITKDGVCQLWSMMTSSLADEIDLSAAGMADGVTCMCLLSDADTSLLLGCRSGGVKIARLVGGQKDGVLRAVEGLELLRTDLAAAVMRGDGEVQHIACSTAFGRTLTLVQHARSGIAVLDLEAKALLASVHDGMQVGGYTLDKVTACCWIDAEPGVFMSGHANGDLIMWRIPDPSSSDIATAQQRLRVAPIGGGCAAVRSITAIANRHNDGSASVLVFGGQQIEQPDCLTLASMPLTPSSPEGDLREAAACEAHVLPWFGSIFGHVLVPPKGSIRADDDPAAVIVLTEGGKLVVHDLQSHAPVPFNLPFQDTSAILAAEMVELAPQQSGGCGVDMVALRQHASRLGSGVDASIAAAALQEHNRWAWVLSGGRPPRPRHDGGGCGDVLATLHRDGYVRLWDLFAVSPALLATVPSQEEGALMGGGAMKAATCMRMCVKAGLLAVAHDRADVLLYRWCAAPRAVPIATLSIAASAQRAAPTQRVEQPPGFQLIARLQGMPAAVHAMDICPQHALLAVGDAAGNVACFDLSAPAVLFVVNHPVQPQQNAAVEGIACLRFANMPVAAESSEEALALVVVSSACSTAAVRARDGSLISKSWMRPKHSDTLVKMVLLDEDCMPVWPCDAPCTLPWTRCAATGAAADDSMDAAQRDTAADDVSEGGESEGESDDGGDGAHDDDGDDVADYLARMAEQVDNLGPAGGRRRRRQKRDERRRAADKDRRGGANALGMLRRHRKSTDVGSGPGTPTSHVSSPVSTAQPAAAATTSDAAHGITAQHAVPSSASECAMPLSHAADAASSADGSGAMAQYSSDDGVTALRSVSYFVLCTLECLRLYSVESLFSAERSTLAKERFGEGNQQHGGSQSDVGFAAAFQASDNAAAIVTLSRSNVLRVYSLPRFHMSMEVNMRELCGWHWNWQHDPRLQSMLHSTQSTDRYGGMALIGPCAELARIALTDAAAIRPPQHSTDVYDFELAAAAMAASQAAFDGSARGAMAGARARVVGGNGGNLQSEVAERFTGFLSQMRNAATSAVTETREGFEKIAKLTEKQVKDLERGIKQIGAQGAQPFGSFRAGSGERGALEPQNLSTSPPASSSLQPPAAAGVRRFGQPSGSTAAGGDGEGVRARTAAEIKAAYGRPAAPQTTATRRANDVAAVMADNRARLAERGEHLNELNDRANDLADSAAGFADLAAQLNSQQRRKWWQL